MLGYVFRGEKELTTLMVSRLVNKSKKDLFVNCISHLTSRANLVLLIVISKTYILNIFTRKGALFV